MTILCYSDWTRSAYSHNERGEPIICRRWGSDCQRIATAIDHQGKIDCIYCRKLMRLVFHESADGWPGDGTSYGCNRVYECRNCGWWFYDYAYALDHYQPMDSEDRELYRGIVKRFDLSFSRAPLSNLREVIKRDPSLLYKISPRKMEEMVKYCFEAHFGCEVEHCGRSHDGGVDLVMVQADEPVLIQVKRRESPRKAESIGAVREFLGAMLLKRSRSGIFVTTADHFSADAVTAISWAIDEELVRRLICLISPDLCRCCGLRSREGERGFRKCRGMAWYVDWRAWSIPPTAGTTI
jgi:restriction system protein